MGLDMKHLFRPFASSLLLLVLSGLGSRAIAQGPPSWTTLPGTAFNVPLVRQIHVVTFLDKYSKPDSGCLGDSNRIYYTKDGGATWTESTISSNVPGSLGFVQGWVNDISFKDAMNGAAVITNNLDPTDHGVLLTTDAGETWTFDDAAGTPDSGHGVYWNPDDNVLMVSSPDKGLTISSDNGNTWQVVDSGKHYTGFAFTSSSDGVVATWGSQPAGFTPNYPMGTYERWRITLDTLHHVLGMLAARRHSDYAYVSRQHGRIPRRRGSFTVVPMMLRSDNGGISFAATSNYNVSHDTLTQDVAGDACNLFAPSYFSGIGCGIPSPMAPHGRR